jgi:hypothetical protein
MRITVDADKAIADLKRQFAGMEPAKFNRAIAMGLNETMTRVNTAAKKAIRERYNINNAAIERKGLTGIKKANGRSLAVALSVRTTSVPLIAFKGVKQGKVRAVVKKGGTVVRRGKNVLGKIPSGKNNDGGVQVEIVKGNKKRIPSAFLQRMKNGHVGVFGRGKYGKGGFNWRTGRLADKPKDLPITELTTVTYHRQYVSKHIQPKLQKVADDNLTSSLTRAVKHQLNLK